MDTFRSTLVRAYLHLPAFSLCPLLPTIISAEQNEQVLPEVASATSSYMIVFTALASTVSNQAFGELRHDYSAVLFPLGFVCTLIGQLVLSAVIRRTKRRSHVVLIIFVVIAVSTVLMVYQSALTTIKMGLRAGHGNEAPLHHAKLSICPPRP